MTVKELQPGMEFVSSATVDDTNTAAALGSGDLKVFATPAMVALMENAAMKCVADGLPEGSTTVGSEISVSHSKATAFGRKVTATAKLDSVEGRKLTFTVSASDEAGLIGKGTHVRFIVDREKFLSKLG